LDAEIADTDAPEEGEARVTEALVHSNVHTWPDHPLESSRVLSNSLECRHLRTSESGSSTDRRMVCPTKIRIYKKSQNLYQSMDGSHKRGQTAFRLFSNSSRTTPPPNLVVTNKSDRETPLSWIARPTLASLLYIYSRCSAYNGDSSHVVHVPEQCRCERSPFLGLEQLAGLRLGHTAPFQCRTQLGESIHTGADKTTKSNGSIGNCTTLLPSFKVIVSKGITLSEM
jgi:hypothetical protein